MSVASSSTQDPAASLRAAALLTLKSKRRKADSAPTDLRAAFSSRPGASQPSIQLDYGDELMPGATSDASSAPPLEPAVVAVPPPVQKPQQCLSAMDADQTIEEGEIEEGEISESGSTPPVSTVKLPPVNARPPPAPLQAPINLTSHGKKIPAPIQTGALVAPPSISSAASSSMASAASVQQMPPPSLPYVIDEKHIRPGLEMTQAQFDAAKDIVLDLLGWGVPPEYLVNCGVSRQIVYYVFVELNLRLPQNLDTTGIIPYDARSLRTVQPWGPTSTTDMTPQLDALALAPKLSASLLDRLDPGPSTSRQKQILEPSIQWRGTNELSATAAPFVPTSPASTASPRSDSNLATMEAQRRQELLARKAVLAQKRSKPSSPSPTASTAQTGSSEPLDSQDVDMAPVTQSVDEFLKSIETAGDISRTVAMPTPERQSPNRTIINDSYMDEEIPGLPSTTDNLPPYTPTTASRSMSASEVLRPSIFTSEPLPIDGPLFAGENLSSGQVTRSTSSTTEDMDVKPGLELPPKPSSRSTFPMSQSGRRAAKRPVAADFDDMSPGPSRAGTNGYGLGHFHGAKRRKNGGFAGLSGARRCVIDLSDSESEVEDVNGPPQPHTAGDTSRGYTNGRDHSHANGTRKNSPNNSSQSAPTPNILAAKEAEIRKMRELIAEREQMRLKKLAVASANTFSSSTPPPLSANINDVPASPVSIKREEDDSQSLYASSTAASTIIVNGLSSFPADSIATKRETEAPPPIAYGPSIDIPLPESASTTSGAPTPIDIIANAMEHPDTGDRVLTAEAQREQVVPDSQQILLQSEASPAVGVASSQVQASAQDHAHTVAIESYSQGPADEARLRNSFDTYHSVLDSYPALRSSNRGSRGDVFGARLFHATPNDAHKLDLKPLKTLAIQRLLGDPARRICQYEIPGGGECRDRDCEDLHLSRLPPVEPSDEETARYLCAAVVGFPYSVQQVREELESLRARQPTKTFDDRVAKALTLLGVR